MATINTQIQEKVTALTGLSAEEHNQLVYNCAFAYLQGFMPAYPQIITQVTKSSVFWKWWINHWEQRDKEFIEKCEHWPETPETRMEIYKEDHDPRTLVEAVYLSGQVLEASYAEMIGQVMDEQKQEVAA